MLRHYAQQRRIQHDAQLLIVLNLSPANDAVMTTCVSARPHFRKIMHHRMQVLRRIIENKLGPGLAGFAVNANDSRSPERMPLPGQRR